MTLPVKSNNTAVFPQLLLTGAANVWNGVPVAYVTIPQYYVTRSLRRIILATTLTVSDMVSTQYWDGIANQAPFYLFQGVPSYSNIQDFTLIGNMNVQEYIEPIDILPHTDFSALWLGVQTASVGKCLVSFYMREAR